MSTGNGRDPVAELSTVVDALAEVLDCPRDEAVRKVVDICRALPLSTDGVTTIVRNAQRVRMRRNEIMGVDLFRDPAWDMLAELMLARREGRTVSVSALCFASGVPATTALRHVEWMEEGGLITRRGDFDDHRRVLVDLAPGVEQRFERIVREMYAESLIASLQTIPSGDGD